VHKLAVFRLVAPAAIVALAATVGTTGSVVLRIDAVVVEGAVFGIVDNAVVADASAVSCKIRKGTAVIVVVIPAVVSVVISVVVFVIEPMAAWIECETAAVDTAVGAEAVVACTVFGVTAVGGVVVNVVVVFAVVLMAAVGDLGLLQLCCWGSIAVVHLEVSVCSCALWFLGFTLVTSGLVSVASDRLGGMAVGDKSRGSMNL
jgi:hypothetical protein